MAVRSGVLLVLVLSLSVVFASIAEENDGVRQRCDVGNEEMVENTGDHGSFGMRRRQERGGDGDKEGTREHRLKCRPWPWRGERIRSHCCFNWYKCPTKWYRQAQIFRPRAVELRLPHAKNSSAEEQLKRIKGSSKCISVYTSCKVVHEKE